MFVCAKRTHPAAHANVTFMNETATLARVGLFMKHTAERICCLEQRQAVPRYTPPASPQKHHMVTWLPQTEVFLFLSLSTSVQLSETL